MEDKTQEKKKQEQNEVKQLIVSPQKVIFLKQNF